VFNTIEAEYLVPTLIVWGQPVRKSCIHLQIELQRPRSNSLGINIEGLIVLKALLKSTNSIPT